MLEHIWHVGAIGSIPSVQKVIDVYALIQHNVNIFVIERHLMGDICMLINTGIKTFNVQHEFDIPSHCLTWNQISWQYPHGHVIIYIINGNLGVWAFLKLPCITSMAAYALAQK